MYVYSYKILVFCGYHLLIRYRCLARKLDITAWRRATEILELQRFVLFLAPDAYMERYNSKQEHKNTYIHIKRQG